MLYLKQTGTETPMKNNNKKFQIYLYLYVTPSMGILLTNENQEKFSHNLIMILS